MRVIVAIVASCVTRYCGQTIDQFLWLAAESVVYFTSSVVFITFAALIAKNRATRFKAAMPLFIVDGGLLCLMGGIKLVDWRTNQAAQLPYGTQRDRHVRATDVFKDDLK